MIAGLPISGSAVALRCATDARWLPQALANFDAVLVDHAHCEKKAASNALSLLQAYPQVPGLAAQMARIAREESGHLARVLALMEERGLTLTRDDGDPYAQQLQRLIRTTPLERRMDRLLIAAVIEARSCERLFLLGEGLSDPLLGAFYRELAQSEAGHQELFVRLAVGAHGEDLARARLEELEAAEVIALAAVGVRPAIH